MKNWICIAIVFCLFGCNDDETNPADNIVHLAGEVYNSSMDGDKIASYWKDGMYTGLTSGDSKSDVGSLYVDGNSVFIGGSTRIPGSMPAAVFWKDGTANVIEGAFGNAMVVSRNNNLYSVRLSTTSGWMFDKNGVSKPMRDTAYSFAPMAMAVLNDDIYIAGYSSGRVAFPAYAPPHAQYWKNDQLIFRESKPSNALSAFIHQNDIYIAGNFYSNDLMQSTACYWKNGQRVDLSDGSKPALAKSIFIIDSHIYAAGMMNDQAVYWKDGVLVYLTTEGTQSMANSIFVRGNDVHVGGTQHGYPAYWKNDARQEITDQDKRGQVKFVVVGSN